MADKKPAAPEGAVPLFPTITDSCGDASQPVSPERPDGCLLCGAELLYLEEARELRCAFCGDTASSTITCPEGHFVCDACHGASAIELIVAHCERTEEVDPVALAATLMRMPAVHMHGPEHHLLVPAVLIATFDNASGAGLDRARLLKQARKRTEHVRGGFCGTHGACGAGIGVGLFMSLIHGTTPLSEQSWSTANRATGETLLVIAKHGGPRCCKRDTYLAILEAVSFVAREMDVLIPVSRQPLCEFSERNRQCRRSECPFYKTE